MLIRARLTACRTAAVCAAVILCSCSSTDINNTGSPAIAAALDDQYSDSRTVAVYLVADRGLGFTPTYIDRIVTAEPVISNTVVRAEATTKVQGINTVIVGDSCETLSQKYSDLISCRHVDSTSRYYGEAEATSSTDSEGFAVITLGAGQYRVSMQSWVTTEDQKCRWSGSEILAENASSLKLQIMVFCE